MRICTARVPRLSRTLGAPIPRHRLFACGRDALTLRPHAGHQRVNCQPAVTVRGSNAAAGHVFITSQNVKQNVTDLLGRKAAAKLFDEQVGLRARARARGKEISC